MKSKKSPFTLLLRVLYLRPPTTIIIIIIIRSWVVYLSVVGDGGPPLMNVFIEHVSPSFKDVFVVGLHVALVLLLAHVEHLAIQVHEELDARLQSHSIEFVLSKLTLLQRIVFHVFQRAKGRGEPRLEEDHEQG